MRDAGRRGDDDVGERVVAVHALVGPHDLAVFERKGIERPPEFGFG
jgi:hypothetical protein